MKLRRHRMNIGLFRLGTWACALAMLLGGMQLHASLILSAGSVNVLAGSTGNTIDISLTNTGPASLVIGGFSLQVSVSGTAVTFNSVSDATASPYIFAGHSAFGPDIATNVSGQMASASDLFDVPLSGTTVDAGTTFGLADIIFSVAPQTPPGTYPVTIGVFPSSSISDPGGNNISINSLTTGQITITGVPEPGPFFETGMTLLLALPALLIRRRLRFLRRKLAMTETNDHL